MVTTDIHEGMHIDISLPTHGTTVHFPATICKIIDHKILIEAVTYQTHVLDFSTTYVDIYITDKSQQSLRYHNCTLKEFDLSGHKYHVLDCDSQPTISNKRRCVRQFMGTRTTALLGTEGQEVPVIVRDISSTGFGLLIEKKYGTNLKTGTPVRFYVSDPDYDFSLELSGHVTRKNVSSHVILYGGTLAKHYPMLDNYITERRFREYGHTQKLSRRSST